jgi:hypothetical protein
MKINIHTIHIPLKRAFSWRAWGILVALYFLGNLVGIPLLRETNTPVEPVWFWFLITGISGILIGGGLILGGRTGLGAPLIEGHIDREEIKDWLRSVLALALLTSILGSIAILWLQRPPENPEQHPTWWKLILASSKAGIVEEIYTRLLLVPLFVWLGGKISRDQDGRPTNKVYWIAIVLSGLWFGWEHLEDRLSIPGIDNLFLFKLTTLNTVFGIVFARQFWKLGLECAMLSHFMVDALASVVIVPAYLSGIIWVWIAVGAGLLILAGLALRLLRPVGMKIRQ